jgi:hypothetical protein
MLRIYYSNNEYEPGKHKIVTTYSDRTAGGMPEETSGSLGDYSVIEVDEPYNPNWHRLLSSSRFFLGLPDIFYVNNNGEIVDSETGNTITINPNPQRESYKLSALYGLNQEQLETYIDNNVTTLAQAKTFLKKLSAVVLWLVKQTKLDEYEINALT